ncbi:MAG: hypothetical protein M1812_003171 [Candelaria pacifica]|nr:MAG: hypothetical protein M1812_003171 [Candelaria pacifica]
MPRSRVLSFMSQFGGPPRSPTSASSPSNVPATRQEVYSSSSAQHFASPSRDSPTPPRPRTERPSSRPVSMVQTYQPPLMEVAQDTLPELQPIFTFLNSHSNKLYQEGYFLKLNDLDSYGRPSADRSWTECFAQLVGTVLSLWDAAALDAAGQDGEVVPTFVNLTDASIKMMGAVPTSANDTEPLQNVLSVSTAGKNRYLLHFNSLHSLTQWTAGIRLAMFEHATLQEAYTGSLIAGKGKMLNNIRTIMDRSKFKTEDWARVRFGAGTPWRRCWCVISPPDEKEIQKQQKSLKKKSAYDRTVPVTKGNIKFFDTKKTKKVEPIATITDAYSAYAIYPQSKPLIDQSTLVKVEGTITIHSTPESTTEGFVFVMPEVHPAVTGFEMMLRWLFPVFDTFALYGRPNRLVADTLDVRSLMFAMPKRRRYGYLEILDVAGLIHTEGSQAWQEIEWRKRLKDLTSRRITTLQSNESRHGSRTTSRRGTRSSLPPSRSGTITFDDAASVRSTPSLGHTHAASTSDLQAQALPPKTGSAPPAVNPFPLPRHNRSVSEAQGYGRYQSQTPSRLSYEAPEREAPPPPPPHTSGVAAGVPRHLNKFEPNGHPADHARSSSESDKQRNGTASPVFEELQPISPPQPVAAPPAFAHAPGAKPSTKPYHSPELRRANSRMSTTTLSQLAGASGIGVAAAGASAAWKSSSDGSRNDSPQRSGVQESEGHRGVFTSADNKYGKIADHDVTPEGMVASSSGPPHNNRELPPLPPSESYHETHQNQSQSMPYETREQPREAPYQSDFTHRQPSHNAHLERGVPAPLATSVAPAAARYYASPVGMSTSNERGTYPTEEQQAQFNSVGPAHNVTANTNGISSSNNVQRSEPTARLQSSRSIARKPLARQSQNADSEMASVRTSSSIGSLRHLAIDQNAIDQVGRAPTMSSDGGDFRFARRPSNTSSNYDNNSVASPDYASTRKSTDTKSSTASVARPRTGVMRTVGTVEPTKKEVIVGDVRYQPDARQQPTSSDIPTVDFGPTYAVAHGSRSRPGTSGTMTQAAHDRSKSSERLATPGGSPGEGKRGSPGYHGRQSPAFSREHSRSPSQNLMTSEAERFRSSPPIAERDGRRSVAWQPGMAPMGNNAGQGLTPEQFVQQRAAAAAGQQQSRTTPIYAHQRKNSSNALRSEAPPNVRNASGEWAAQRSASKELPPRPHSRGASAVMTPGGGAAGSADYSSHLSAREQEHVARVTGSPLINMAGGGRPRQQSPGGGLVGAIEAREREKKDMKGGLSGQMVQHAILQRQQQAQAYQYAQPAYPSPQMGTPPQTAQNYGRAQSPYGMPQPYQVSPGAQVFAQGGGWGAPQYQYQQQFQQQYQQPAQQQQQQPFNPYFPNNQQGRPGQGY